MRPMHDDAPPLPGLADRLSRPLAAQDPSVNALHDRLNEAVPWLWWPLTVPSASARLGASEHALYAVHAGLGLVAVTLVAPRTQRRRILRGGALIALGSWAVFSGAWDRRADQAANDERRAL